MNDYIVRATAGNAQIRAFAAVTTNLVEEAREHHGTSPVATAALGRLLTGGVMMGSMMKNDTDMLTIQIQCSGQLEGLTVTADRRSCRQERSQRILLIILQHLNRYHLLSDLEF